MEESSQMSVVEESLQMSVVEEESQQTLAESQMSDQNFQESQSQMEISQELLEDLSQPKEAATDPKRPKIDQEKNAPPSTTEQAIGHATGEEVTGQEESQMEISQQPPEDSSQPEDAATDPKESKIDLEVNAPPSTTEQAIGHATGEEATGQKATDHAVTGQKPPGQEPPGQGPTGKGPTGQGPTEPDKNLSRNGHQSEKVDKSDEKMVPEKRELFMDFDAPFPETLEGFKYAFNEQGELRHTETGRPFEFEVKWGNRYYNQQHYEALGEVITQHVYQLLETEAKLKKVYLSVDEDEPRTFIFMSENALTTTDKLLILIHGSGVVRAGQWARRLIINDCLDSGTQIPYIQRAMQEGYEVLVMNTNDNYATLSNGRRVSIKGSSGPTEHGLAVWDRFVAETPAEHVAIVAHSYGGVVTVDLAIRRAESFRRKVFAVAFTDSVHSLPYDDDTHEWFVNNAKNWVTSHKQLGTVIDDRGYDCERISAGTMKHEETSWYSFPVIFDFFKNQEEKRKYPTTVSESAMENTEPAADDSTPVDSPETPGTERTEQPDTQAQGTGEGGGRETDL